MHRKMKITTIYVEAKETGFTVEDVHIYENADGYAIVKANIYTKWDGGLPVGAFIKAVSSATGMAWRAAKDTKALITSICTPVTLYEDTSYYALSGIATKKKTGSSVSGDSFGMFELDSGIYNVCLSENGEFLVMVPDGVLEYLHVKNPVEKLCEIVADAGSDNAGVISQDILDRVLLMTGGYAMDDMTVITIGVWEK